MDRLERYEQKKMKSEGDHWSMATLTGADIWDCLDSNKIDRLHLVQWKRSCDDCTASAFRIIRIPPRKTD